MVILVINSFIFFFLTPLKFALQKKKKCDSPKGLSNSPSTTVSQIRFQFALKVYIFESQTSQNFLKVELAVLENHHSELSSARKADPKGTLFCTCRNEGFPSC